MRKDFPIKMYIGGPSHEPYFIVLILWGQIIIESMKKLVTTYVVRFSITRLIHVDMNTKKRILL